jgi:hypothetical protein
MPNSPPKTMVNYTLLPLVSDGRNCLACRDVEGIEWVEFYYGGSQWQRITRKSDDIFALVENEIIKWPALERIAAFTQEFICVVNIGKKRVGPFAAPKIFRFAAYPEPFTGQLGQVCQYSGYFRMDYELAAIYNTALGIGIEAAKADVGSKAKGLHWRWLLMLPFLLTVSVFGFRWFGGVWVRAVLPGSKKQAVVSGMRPVGTATSPQAVSVPAVTSASPAVSVENGQRNIGGENVFVDKNVWMLGWALEGGKARVALSDGRWVTRQDGLTRVTQSYCVMQGRVYRMRSLEEQRRDEERAARSSIQSWRRTPGDHRTAE